MRTLHALLLITLLPIVVACGNGDNTQVEEPTQTVLVEPLNSANSAFSRTFIGRTDALKTVDVSFEVPGQLASLPVKEGQVVAQGELLAKLDTEPFELAVEDARLQVKLARADFNRKQKLLEAKAVSTAIFEQSETNYRQSEVALSLAERDLTEATIKAPFPALITRRLIDSFTNVSAGTPVLRIQDVSDLLVRISVPEDLIHYAKIPKALNYVGVVQNGGPAQHINLSYHEHNTEPDEVTQTYTVTLKVEQPAPTMLLPGMTMEVKVSPENIESLSGQSVPNSALDNLPEGGYRLWLYDPQTEKVSAHPVKVGNVAGDRIPILTPLPADSLVVTAGVMHLRDGMKVHPVQDIN